MARALGRQLPWNRNIRAHLPGRTAVEAIMRNSGNSRLLWAAEKYLRTEEKLDELDTADAAIAARLRRSIRHTRRRLLKATPAMQRRPGLAHFRTVLVAVDGEPAS